MSNALEAIRERVAVYQKEGRHALLDSLAILELAERIEKLELNDPSRRSIVVASILELVKRIEKLELKPQTIDFEFRLLAAVESAGFEMKPSIAGDPVLWCKECGRDSGYHWKPCSKNDGRG